MSNEFNEMLNNAGVAISPEQTNTIVIVLEGKEITHDLEQLDITFDSSDTEIMDAVKGIVNESFEDNNGTLTYLVRKSTETNTIYVIPKTELA